MSMTFRRLYWVLEYLNEDGTSGVYGVYTSIADLVEDGLPAFLKEYNFGNTRLNLVKLDNKAGALATYCTDHFSSMTEKLSEYVEHGDFSVDEVTMLQEKLDTLN